VLVEWSVGGETYRIVIECRDHARKVGEAYVEQIAQRSLDLGRPITHIVSRAGFTSDAEAKARAHGIYLSSITDLKSDRWPSWVVDATIGEKRRFASVIGLGFVPVGGDPGRPIVPPEFSLIDPARVTLFDRSGRRRSTLLSILQKDLPKTLWNDLPAGFTFRDVTVLITIPPKRARFLHLSNRVQIAGLAVALRYGWQLYRAPTTFSEYRSLQQSRLKGESIAMTLLDGTLVQITRSRDGKLVASAVASNEKSPVDVVVEVLGVDEQGQERSVHVALKSDRGLAEALIGRLPQRETDVQQLNRPEDTPAAADTPRK
jgi:hypothetical protein